LSAREAFKVDILLCYITALVGEREREREYFTRENKRSRRRRNSAKTLPFELSFKVFLGQSEEKKEAKMHRKRAVWQSKKKKSALLERNYLFFILSRARDTHTHSFIAQ
jgi:hypothetical protein